MLATAAKPMAFMAAVCLLTSPSLTNRCDDCPVCALCGVERSLASVIVSTSHHLLPACLMFEELCLVLEHASSNLQDPKTIFDPQGCGTEEMFYVGFPQK